MSEGHLVDPAAVGIIVFIIAALVTVTIYVLWGSR